MNENEIKMPQKSHFTKWHVVFMRYGRTGSFRGIYNIVAREMGGFVIGHAHQVHSGARQLHFYIIIRDVFKLNATADILEIGPVGNRGHVDGKLHQCQIVLVVKPLTGLLNKKTMTYIVEILMQRQLPA